MKTPEEIKKALECCSKPSNSHACTECPYTPCTVGPEKNAQVDALAYIQQLEEQIEFMKIQMHGDCGVCVHRYDERMLPDEQLKCKLSPACYECLKKGGRSQWEYEGLPELPEKGAPNEL